MNQNCSRAYRVFASFAGMSVAMATAPAARAQEVASQHADTAPASIDPRPPATVEAPTAPPSVVAGPPAPAIAAAKPKPPPYSLPWQLRPVAPGNVLRLDSSYSFYKNPANESSGSALVSTLLGSYKIVPDLALIGRIGFVDNSPPTLKPQWAHKTDFLNPVVGALYGIKLSPSLKLGLFLGAALPLGDGGNTNSSLGKRGATGVGINTRSAFDNAMFAIDYLTIFPGIDLALVKSGFTVQAEATIFKLTKVRGPSSGALAEEDSRVNFTTGLHAGYFIAPFFSFGVEVRHQRWLSTPAAVRKDSFRRDTTTFALGPRFHFKISNSIWFRPGVSLTLPFDKPMAKLPAGVAGPSEFKVVQLDLPIVF